MSCESTLTFEGTEDSALMFEETIGPCFASRMVFVPMPSGYAIGVEEYGEDAWYSYGARLNKNHRIGYP